MAFEVGAKTVKPWAAAPRTSSKKTAGANTQDANQVTSTNVTSSVVYPPPATSRRSRAATTNNTGVGSLNLCGYADDGLVVDDNDDDDDFAPAIPANDPSQQQDSMGMPMVRRGASTRDRLTKKPTVGAPITTDEFTANLNAYEIDVMERFVAKAKSLRGEIANKLSLRNETIFTDTILRRIGVKLPTKLNELKAIEGVTSEQADRFGKQFIEISRVFSDEKEENMGGAASGIALPTPYTSASNLSASVSKTRSSHFNKGEWVCIDSSDEEDMTTGNENPSSSLDRPGDYGEYDEDWGDEEFQGPMDEGGTSSHHFAQVSSSAGGTVAGKLSKEQAAWKAKFESQASQAGPSVPATAGPSGPRYGGRGRTRGGAQRRGKRSSGTSGAGRSSRDGTGKGKWGSKGGSRGGGAGGGADMGSAGYGAIRPMARK